jgi:hypothetical protein
MTRLVSKYGRERKEILMNTNAEKIRFLLDNGMTLLQIAGECNSTRFHIQETLAGRHQGGPFVAQRLDVLVQEMRDSIAYLDEK